MTVTEFAILAAGFTLSGVGAVAALAASARRVPKQGRLILATCAVGVYVATLVLRPSPWWLIDAVVLVGAVGGVLFLERSLLSPAAVAVFMVVAAAADLVSSSVGVTRALTESYRTGTSDFLLYLTLLIPIAGRPVPIVGVGDLLIAGTAATALVRLNYRFIRVGAALALGLLAALSVGLWRGGAPAIPFMAVTIAGLVWLGYGQARPGKSLGNATPGA